MSAFVIYSLDTFQFVETKETICIDDDDDDDHHHHHHCVCYEFVTIYFILLGDGYFPVMTLTTLLTKLHRRSKLSRLFLKRYYIVLNLLSIFHRFVLN